MVGQSQATCLLSGKWSSPEPTCIAIGESIINPYKPSVLFMGHMEIVQTPHNVVSDHDLHCLLNECYITIWKKKLGTPYTPKIGNGLVLLIRIVKSIRLKWDNHISHFQIVFLSLETIKYFPTCPDPEAGLGVCTLENHKAVWLMVPIHWKITKLPSQHSMLGHHQPASKTPFRYCFTCRPMMARFELFGPSLLPSSTKKEFMYIV